MRIRVPRKVRNSGGKRRDAATLARQAWWAKRILASFDLVDSLAENAKSCPELAKLVGFDRKPFLEETRGADAFRKQDAARRREIAKARKCCSAALKAPRPDDGTAQFFHNCAAVAAALRLGETECEALEFALMAQREPGLSEIDALLGDLHRDDCIDVVAAATGAHFEKVELALRPLGALALSGLVRLDPKITGRTRMCMFFDLMTDLNLSLHSPAFTVNDLLDKFASPVLPTPLTLDDYPHLAEFSSLALRVLGTALEHGTPGVNLLIYGAPGTGKTEYAKALAAAVNADLREVPTADLGGDSLPGVHRARGFQFAQAALNGRSRQLLMFDEIEDLFPELSFALFAPKEKVVSKGWVNRVLETNRVPTLWLSNEIEQMDPAYRRRFNLAIEFRVPPRKVRQRIASHHLDGLGLSTAFIGRIADAEQVSPALVQQAAAVARLAKGGDQADDVSRALKGALDALGLPPLSDAEAMVTEYSLEYLNPSADLAAIVAGLKRTGEGRLCLFGEPGTGKTAFARHLAVALDRPLIAKRASDLMSMWVGETEKNIAKMFREAEEGAAVLLLDEADSMLRDRNQAKASWEATRVNEMLTNMERFRGVFVCSTNLQADLDAASLRRFDRKIEFRPLRPDQRWTLLEAFLLRYQVAVPTGLDLSRLLERLDSLDSLTPGDYAAVARGRLLEGGIKDAAEVVRDLAAECAVKRGAGRPMGFLSH